MDYAPIIAQVSKYGDVIVAFCVVQSLAFSYKMGQTNDDVCKAIISGGGLSSGSFSGQEWSPRVWF
jgi:hypothetical protein